MDFSLEAALGQIRWPAPQDFLAINEDDEESSEGPLIGGLPNLRGQDLALPIQDQNLPPQDQGPVQRLQVNLNSISLPEHWPVYKEMAYFGFEEENREEWDAQQNMEEEQEQEEDIEEEIIMNTDASQQGPVDISVFRKPRPPNTNDKRLLQDINSSAEAHIATIGLQEQPMPDATPPAFVPTLERTHPQP